MELLFYAVHQFSGYFRKIPGAGRVLVPAVSRECLCKVQQRRASLQSVFGIVVHEYFLDGHFLVLEDFVVLHQFLQFGFEIYRRISGPTSTSKEDLTFSISTVSEMFPPHSQINKPTFKLSLIVFQHPFLIVSIYHNKRASGPVIFIVFNIGFKPALNNANNATVLDRKSVV